MNKMYTLSWLQQNILSAYFNRPFLDQYTFKSALITT